MTAPALSSSATTSASRPAAAPVPRRRTRAKLRPVPDPFTPAPPVAATTTTRPVSFAGPAQPAVPHRLPTTPVPAETGNDARSGVPSHAAQGAATELPLTVTISIDGGGSVHRERVLAALRDLVAAAGGGETVAVRTDPAAVPGVINLDPKPRAAFRDGRLLDLSRLEYDLLLYFAEHPRQVFSRSQLLAGVWGHVHTGARTVDVHISRLRTKLDDPDLITTVYGVGYRLADDAPIRVV